MAPITYKQLISYLSYLITCTKYVLIIYQIQVTHKWNISFKAFAE